MALAVPEQERLAEPRAGGDHRDVGRAPLTARQPAHLFRGQEEPAVGGRLEVVHQPHALGAEHAAEARRAHDPRQVRGLDPAVEHRSGNAEGGRADPLALAVEESLDDLLQPLVAAAGKRLLTHDREPPALLDGTNGEVGLGAADVSGEDVPRHRLTRRAATSPRPPGRATKRAPRPSARLAESDTAAVHRSRWSRENGTRWLYLDSV